MAISTFSKATGTDRILQTVPQVDGVFTVDVASGTDFRLAFDADAIGSPLNIVDYVGGIQKTSIGGAGLNITVDLTTELTGGVGGYQIGDVILLQVSSSGGGTIPVLNTRGYTVLDSRITTSVWPMSSSLYYRTVNEATFEEAKLINVTVNASTSFATGISVQVFRNINPANPIISTSITYSYNSADITAPYTVQNRNNAVEAVFAACNNQSILPYTNDSTALNSFLTTVQDETYDLTLGAGYTQVASSPISTPTFVGSTSVAAVGDGSISIDLTTLSGGTNSSPQEGDVVIATFALGTVLDITSYTFDSSWTEVIRSYANDNNDVACLVLYKVMGAVPDTSFTLGYTPNASTYSAVLAANVYRNVDPTKFQPILSTTQNSSNPPFDLALQTQALFRAADVPTFVIGASGHNLGAVQFNLGSDLQNYENIGNNGTYDVSLYAGEFTWNGSINHLPPITLTGSSSIHSSTAIVIQLESATAQVPGKFYLNGGGSTSAGAVAYSILLNGWTEFDQRDLVDEISINFTNIPETREPVTIYGYLPSAAGILTVNSVKLNWNENLVQISPAASSVPLGQAVLEQGFSDSNVMFLNTTQNKTFKTFKTEKITYSSVWTAPVDVTEIELLICGGGGGGSAASDDGGGGSVYHEFLSVSPGASYPITIGAGGAVALPGSSTTFGAFTAYGGNYNPDTGGTEVGRPAGLGGPGGRGAGTTYPYSHGDAGQGVLGYGAGGQQFAGWAGTANSGNGGADNEPGGSGVVLIKYWSAY